jgi:hypothetical protein
MHKSELNPAPVLSIPTVPVVCDQCGAAGMAGDEAFAGIPDILDFDPVPRRAHANGWTAEHQRAFVAALAITGSMRQAARTIGRHAFGAEQLRKAKGGKSFDSACEAALDIARDRERERIHANLRELVEENAEAPPGGRPLGGRYASDDSGEDEDAAMREAEETRNNIKRKLFGCRRLYLQEIAPDPAKRAAWEVLCGPTDWKAAAGWEPQEDEADGYPNQRQPGMILTAASGWLDSALLAEPGAEERLTQRLEAMKARDAEEGPEHRA